jgi:molybdopterin-guanine dinucleotide biosynthesis protein A
VREQPAGSGPLAAVAAGGRALRDRGDAPSSVLVLAVDLPFVEVALLAWLAAHPADESVVPRVEGHAQPLCARYTEAALAKADVLVAQGARSMHALLDVIPVRYVEELEWGEVSDAAAFRDIDTPDDLAALGEG